MTFNVCVQCYTSIAIASKIRGWQRNKWINHCVCLNYQPIDRYLATRCNIQRMDFIYIFQILSISRTRWAGNIAGIGNKTNTLLWWGKLRERNHLEDLNVDGRIELKWILKQQGVRTWNGFKWLWVEEIVGWYELRLTSWPQRNPCVQKSKYKSHKDN